ncbi:MAG: hypothetical protein GY798_23820, partial [Hyphomicrobiales bacterium]|nr:hypothetical protein [Hyphomicrobiales bacterium]
VDLFRECLRLARQCHSFDALLETARGKNRELLPPLPDTEVVGCARSAWQYQCEGRNLVGGGRQLVLPEDALRQLACENPDAYALYSILRIEHHGLRDKFAVSPMAMAKSKIMKGWGVKAGAKRGHWAGVKRGQSGLFECGCGRLSIGPAPRSALS